MQLLAIINGDLQLLLLTKDFDVMAEQPVAKDEFGTEAPITVGTYWRWRWR